MEKHECEFCGQEYDDQYSLTHHKCPVEDNRCECCGGPVGQCSSYEDGVPLGMLDENGKVC